MHNSLITRRRHPRGLRNACRTALAAVASLFLAGLPLNAQKYPNGLSADSVDPKTDAIVIKQIRAHLDSVRARENRPVVGLALSGGGAKGAAEIGALRYLFEQDIPIDFICGTSIGGLIGAFTAMGYSIDEMEEIFRTQDWNKMLGDRVDARYTPYTTKQYRSRYQLIIPFHYAPEILESRLSEAVKYTPQDRKDRLDLSASTDKLAALKSSLPSGLTYGFHLNNLLSSVSVGYQDSLAFRDLPIPFICVASDMVSCKEKNWGSGSIVTAMRSTMSIPGLFNPVRTGGMVLVDGGTRNNYPSDLAKAVGADYIIGIDLSDSRLNFATVNNLGDIVNQFFTMLGDEAFNRNLNLADSFIKPDISGYNMMSFSAEAVDTLIRRGYEAALEQSDDIAHIRKRTGAAGIKYNKPRAVDISKTPVAIGQVDFEGVSEDDGNFLRKKTGLYNGITVSRDIMEDAMSRLQATGAFESVTYSIYGTKEPYRLVIHCVPGPTHRLGLGVRMDTEEWASILINVGLNASKLSGAKTDFNLKLGKNAQAEVNYAFARHAFPTINVCAGIGSFQGDLMVYNNSLKFGTGYWTHKEQFYLSDINLIKLNFKAGLQNRYFSLYRGTPFAEQIASVDPSALKGDYLGVFINGEFYTFDDHYYPSRGVNFCINADYDFLKFGVQSFKPVLSLGLDFKAAIPVVPSLTILPEIHLRDIFNAGDLRNPSKDFSIIHTNFAGGAIAGRYVEKQVPFFGFNNVMITESNLATATLDIRFSPIKDLYVSALGGYMLSNSEFAEMFTDFKPYCWAAGVELGFNSVAGPVKFNIHYSSTTAWGLYTSLGFDF